jgi:UDP-3-O-acyl-N-acetylglucosamine deacetylase
MSAPSQKTIKKPISLKGVGLHTGEPVNMKINPAEPNTGIVF